MKKSFLLLSLLFLTSFPLAAEAKKRLEIITYSEHLPYINDPFSNPARLTQLKEKFDITFKRGITQYVWAYKKHDPNVHKIVFFDFCRDPQIKKIPKEKTICFKWEPFGIRYELYNYYYRVYTFEDELIDNKKFFKFYYPVLRPMLPEAEIPSFKEKNLCLVIAKNWNKERVKIVDFFSTKPKDSLHLYGEFKRLPQYVNHPMNKGGIPGYPTSDAKIHTIKKYRFAVCFENTHTIPGYITEKIFDVFAAGCVPIYWGPANTTKYIPEECFIDYQKFSCDEDLYRFLTTMSEAHYERYLKNIRKFLASDKAKLFSPENFDRILTDAILKS